jgi:microcystin-dependent protein
VAAPTGWLLCSGSAVSRSTYADLFAAIGTTHGAGDGSTTFNLPNPAGRSIVGAGTGTVVEAVAAAAVTTANDTLTVASNNRKWTTGMAVVLSTSGVAPTGTTAGNTYYVIRASATTIKLAANLANAQNGTAVDITAQGSGTHTLTHTMTALTLGETGGEMDHAMSSSELLAHTHTGSQTQAAAGQAGADRYAGVQQSVATSSTGGNAAMNNMQPYLAMNFIIKY